MINHPQAGHVSNYYLGELIQDEDVAAVQSATEKLKLAIENTRSVLLSLTSPHLSEPSVFSFILKLSSLLPFHSRVRKNGDNHFTLLVASAEPQVATHKHKHNDREIQLDVEYGDFSDALANAAAALKEAKAYAANENQSKMLDGYIKR